MSVPPHNLNRMRPERIATFFGGVLAGSESESQLAYAAGVLLGQRGFSLYHGGYNGLMELAAQGVSAAGGRAVAVTLAGKEVWGPFNPHVTSAIYAPEMGTRILHLLEESALVIAMGGGVGSLHELTAAIWYAGNIRPVPIILLGEMSNRLLEFLKQERWLYTSPTRPLDFLRTALSDVELESVLETLEPRAADVSPAVKTDRSKSDLSLANRIQRVAVVEGIYRRQDGAMMPSYFDPFRLGSDPALASDIAKAMAVLVEPGVTVIAGIALGGVSLATNLAAAMRRPLLVVRSQPKEYGTFSQIEGVVRRGDQVVLIDDTLRTGERMLATAGLLTNAGLIVKDAICVLERSGPGRRVLEAAGISVRTLLAQLPGGAPDNEKGSRDASGPEVPQ